MVLPLVSCDVVQDLLNKVLGKSDANTLRIGYTDFSFDQAVAYTLKGILDQQPNLQVNLYDVADSTMFKLLAEDKLDIVVSGWLPNTHQHYLDKYPDDIKELSMICDSLGLYMAVPNYALLQTIPDLRSVGALLRNTILIPESQNAVYPLGNEVLAIYGLNTYHLQESSWDNIVSFVDTSLENSTGFAFVAIRPHWIFTRYDLKTIDDTRHAFGTYEQAHIIANNKFETKMPVVAGFLKQVRFTLKDIEQIMDYNQVLGSEPYDNSLKWINSNTYRINKWLIGA
jgi:glycine betaine/proline transport system substrate-binding protein